MNSIIVHTECDVTVPGLTTAHFDIGDVVQPSSRFYAPLIWAGCASDSGIPEVPQETEPYPNALLYFGTPIHDDMPVYDGIEEKWLVRTGPTGGGGGGGTTTAATTSAAGIVRLATNSEGLAGILTTIATSPAVVKAMVDAAMTTLINAAPTALNDIRELASALGDDPNFAATIATQLASTVKLTGPQSIAGTKTFSNSPVVPTDAFPQTAVNGLVTALAAKLNTTAPGRFRGFLTADPTTDLQANDFWLILEDVVP